jgi:nucleotide-binding universal stress UspA family protein
VGTSGPIVEEICKVAHDRAARMIVAGAHGWGPIKRLLHGSISTGLLRAAPCPVLVVSGDTHPGTGEKLSVGAGVAS